MKITETKEFNEEYIVAYNPRFCSVELASDFVFYSDYSHSLKGQYEQAISRKTGKKYGDLVSWNNQWWTVVKASSCKDAVNKVGDQIIAQIADKR